MPNSTRTKYFLFISFPLLLSTLGLANEAKPSKELIELSNSIMERQVTGGATMHGGVEPLLWSSSRYLLEGPTHARFVRALDAFNALPADKMEAIPPLHRALVQRQLWMVFDWLHRRHRRTPEAIGDGFQKKVMTALKKAALSKQQIASLPNPYEITVKAKRYPIHNNSEKAFEPYLPDDLFAEKGPWVALDPNAEGAATPEIHGDDQDWRTAFTILVALPGGREKTLSYLQKLQKFTPPFDTGRGGKIHPDTPQFPKGTRWALVRRGLLISNEREIVSSPLVESVQLRTFHSVLPRDDPKFPKPIYWTHGVVVAQLDVDSAQALTGAAPILHALPELSKKPQPFPSRGHEDPFPDLNKARVPTTGLVDCASCHGRHGIHSIASRNLLFRASVKVTPVFRVGTPSQSHNFAIKRKKQHPSWNKLQESWKTTKG